MAKNNTTENLEEIQFGRAPASRDSRALLSRASEMRSAKEREPATFHQLSRFNIPLSCVNKLKEAGLVGAFINHKTDERDLQNNYDNAIGRQWRPALAAEFPEMARLHEYSPYEKSKKSDYIIKDGMIFMIRLEEDDKSEREHYERETRMNEEVIRKARLYADKYGKPQRDPNKATLHMDNVDTGKWNYI